MYKDGRKCGEPAEVTMVPKMVYDRRGGQAFDVHGQIAAVRRVVLRTPAPEKLLGFPCWAFGDKDFLVVSDFEALLTAEPLPFQKIKRVETTGDPLFDYTLPMIRRRGGSASRSRASWRWDLCTGSSWKRRLAEAAPQRTECGAKKSV